MKLSHVVVVAGGLLAAATASSFAAENTETIGQRLQDGSMSQMQFQQLIQFTGLSADEAKSQTLDEVVSKRWKND